MANVRGMGVAVKYRTCETLMIAGSIPGQTQTLSIAVYEAVQAGDDALANSLVLLVSAVCVAILLGVGRLARARDGRA